VLTAGELVLDKDLHLVGPGRHLLTVSGNRTSRVLWVAPQVTASIAKITITRGHAHMGGVYNQGTLTITQSTLRGKTARNSGGGVYNAGTLTITRSTLSGNTARLADGGVRNRGTLTITYSTLSNNKARNGGGILSYSSKPLRLSTTIIAGNTATVAGPDCYQQGSPFSSRGHNLTGVDTGCPNNPSQDDVTVDPAVVFTQVLGPLRDNGGSTFTHALLPGSPALDASDPQRCGGTDQRGVRRPQGTGCDIGAFELEVP
jgi:hypothetical protein